MEPLVIQQGTENSFEGVIEYLNGSGYLRVSRATEEGYYSVSGGNITIFPFGSENAVMLDYFGDTVETIKAGEKNKSYSSLNIMPFHLEAV